MTDFAGRPTAAGHARFADTLIRDRRGDDTAWQARASCAGLHSTDPTTDPFFPHASTCGNDTELFFAKQICGGCPVRYECGEFAIETMEPYGVWGGMSPAQRQRIRRQRREDVA